MVASMKEDSSSSSVPVYIAATMMKHGDTGVHTHFNTLSAYWTSRGTPVEILTPYEAPALLRLIVGLGMRALLLFNVELAWFFKDVLYTKLLWLRMRTMLPKNGPWVVYAQCPVASRVAGQLRNREDQSIVLITHFNKSHAEENVESGIASRGGHFYRWIQGNDNAGLLGADRIVYVSKFMRDYLINTVVGLSSRPFVVLPNFVSGPACAGDEYGGDLASIGTLEPRKNQSFLLEVLAAAKRKGKRYTLTLFGTGKPEQEWRQLATALGIADQVTFAGYVPQASRWLHRFRAYVHAAKIENMPVSLIEALACGLPIIAAPVGGIPEIVTEGINGFFWNLEDPEQAAEIVMSLLEDQSLLASMRAAALERYAENFSTERIAPRLTNFIMNGATL